MSVLADRFAMFFAAANDGGEPYPWQMALMERTASTGTWPDAITAPTGAGKSAVVDIHVFLVCERARGAMDLRRPPRRLVLVAPRRVLVDDQYDRARRLAELIGMAEGDGPLAQARVALMSLVTSHELRDDPLGVARLRGGLALDLSWRLDPSRCQIVCATPQMWGSRLLMRGFRAARRAANLESGLLAHDTAVVIDEAHLHRRLVDTARAAASAGCRGPGGLQVVAVSATQEAAAGISLGREDLAHPELSRRVHAPKRVEIELVDDWTRERTSRMVTAARRLRHARPDCGTVGVFVNTVAAALDVAERLKSSDDGPVHVVCGRMRPADVARLRAERPGLLDSGGDPDVAYLISTQSLEVGVDLDLPAMVSELAPASALAQRAGRLNRSGSRTSSSFVVVAPRELADGDAEDFTASVLPYDAVELERALRWLATLDGSIAPSRVCDTELPLPARRSLPALTQVELQTLAMTSIDLAANPEPGFYIEPEVDRGERNVFVAARDHLDLDDEVVAQALRAAPPRAHELATISIGKALNEILAVAGRAWTIRTRAGAIEVGETEITAIRPGDVIVIAAGSRVRVDRVLGLVRGRPAGGIDDVMLERPEGAVPDRVVKLDGARSSEVAKLNERDPVLGTRAARTALADVVEGADRALAQRLRRHRRVGDLVVTWCSRDGDREAPGLLVVVGSVGEGHPPAGIAAADETVTVDDHCAAVADRAQQVVEALDGMAEEARDAVVDAARAHDEGKRHPEFQRRMGAAPDELALAKPKPGHTPERGDGWRHEQLSAGYAHARHGSALTTTLTAAHHGNGRPLFNRDVDGVLAGWAECPKPVAVALGELFGPAGRYESDRAAVEQAHGVHRIAFLEALVRCADMQVSREVES